MMMKMKMVKMWKTHKYERSAELTTTGRKGGAIAVVEVRVPEKQTIRFHKTLQWNKTYLVKPYLELEKYVFDPKCQFRAMLIDKRQLKSK